MDESKHEVSAVHKVLSMIAVTVVFSVGLNVLGNHPFLHSMHAMPTALAEIAAHERWKAKVSVVGSLIVFFGYGYILFFVL